MSRRGTQLCAWAAGLAAAAGVTAFALAATPVKPKHPPADVTADDLYVRVLQPEPERLVLGLWPIADTKISGAVLETAGVRIEGGALQPFPEDNQSAAVLLLLDTSDPVRRQDDVRRLARDAVRLMDEADDNVRFALARLATNLEILAPFGSGRETVRAAAEAIRAEGATTELFRNTIGGIEQVARTDAERKAVVVLSDGRQEDTAFTYEDVVAAARAAGVVVFGLGYSQTRAGTRWYQSLRRISEATGGLFLGSDQELQLPEDFPARVLGVLSRGGRMSFDLRPVMAAGAGGARTADVTVAFERTGPVSFEAPLVLPEAGLATRLVAPRNRPYVGAGAFGVAVFGVLLGLVVARRSRRTRAARQTAAAAATPYAFLEFFDGAETRFPVGDKAVRIGRSANNDLQLHNTSVSAYHAEIQRRRDGSFIVTDLDSLNGVAINDEAVDVGLLKDGDVVDLGEVRFRFRLNPARPSAPAGAAVDEGGTPP